MLACMRRFGTHEKLLRYLERIEDWSASTRIDAELASTGVMSQKRVNELGGTHPFKYVHQLYLQSDLNTSRANSMNPPDPSSKVTD